MLALETVKNKIEFSVVARLTEANLASLSEERGAQKPVARVKRLSERHRNLARIVASGAEDWDASLQTGYTRSSISILKSDPAFKELVQAYSAEKDIIYETVHQKLAGVAAEALDVIRDRLEENPDDITLPQLIALATTGADRTGAGPQSTTTQVNVNVDIATRLQVAREKARLIRADFEELETP